MVNQRASRAQPKLFDRVLVEAVNDGLKAVLGEPAAMTILYHLEKNCSLKMENIPEEPANFVAEMKNVFGEGASLIETSIVKDLYTKLGLEHQTIKDYGFADYVKHAKEKVESTLKLEDSCWRRTKF